MKTIRILLFVLLCATFLSCNNTATQKENQHKSEKNMAIDSIQTKSVTFTSEGVSLSGTIYAPKNPHAGVVLVHGSDAVPRMTNLAEQLAAKNILVFTYDKRGVGESEGIYVGPEVGTNNVSEANLQLLAKDATAAIHFIHQKETNLPIGLVGASQAGWIIPIAAYKNPLVDFMVLFSAPTITTLEQLRFQFYTNGRKDFWKNHTLENALEHMKNDPDKYKFTATDPLKQLENISIPGLWLYGSKDIQIPSLACIQDIERMQSNGKPFEFLLYSNLGHNTYKEKPIEEAVKWIKKVTKK